MGRESNCFFVPRTSLRSPGFFGPVTLAAAIVVASIFTAPFDDDFSLLRISDPTFTGTVGIWGVCTRYHTENATTANPNATLTGNATFDAIVHQSGKHKGCSPAAMGWSFSIPVNSTGLAGMPLPDSSLGFNVDPSANTTDLSWVPVMTKTQSMMLVIHLIAGLLPATGLVMLVIPYKPFDKSLPGLAKFLKSGSASLLLVTAGCITSLISFILCLMVATKVRDNINQIGGGAGTHAALGNIMWFDIAAVVLYTPSIWSTRGAM